jgi:endonuclease/exonuclease/phosphatase family metal-dependent hydrolase
VAVISKHPIIASRDTVFEAQNGMIQADIKMGDDTIRVIGLHLYSMTLQLRNLVHQKEMDGMAREGKITFRQMRKGFERRAGELAVLESWIKESPYPTVVCGDFNEVPYGYVYGRMKDIMGNSFEEKGKGFGFTYNHIPYFIRIDHQFYSKKTLRVTDFNTYQDVKYSDHYPVSGVYSIRRHEDKY